MNDADYNRLLSQCNLYTTKNGPWIYGRDRIDYFDLLQKLSSRYILNGSSLKIVFVSEYITSKLQFALYDENNNRKGYQRYFTTQELMEFYDLNLRLQCDILDTIVQEAFHEFSPETISWEHSSERIGKVVTETVSSTGVCIEVDLDATTTEEIEDLKIKIQRAGFLDE